MNFMGQKVITSLKHTTEPGQLLSITDAVPQHDVGLIYRDEGNDKAYMYVYNGTGAAHVQYSLELLEPLGGASVHWQTDGIADHAASYCFVVAPAAAHPNLYYGWVQFYGDVDAAAGFASEAVTANEECVTLDATYVKGTADTQGVNPTAFALVNTTNAVAGTSHDIFLIGREIVTAT